MKIVIRIFVNTIIIWLTEEFYYGCIYANITHYNYKVLSQIIIFPSIFVLLLLMVFNYLLNRIDKLSMSFNFNMTAALIGAGIVAFIWFEKGNSIKNFLFHEGMEIPKFITGTIVLFSILLIWFIKFCVTSFLLKHNIEKKIKP